MPNNPYYVFDANLCKAEGLTREQIINAIAEATGVTPQNVDDGFISTILENNHSRSINIWKGSRAEFNALESKSSNTLYIIDDDTTIADFEALVNECAQNLNDMADNLGNVDTGWIDLARQTVDAETKTFGKYRIIGKIAHFVFNYDVRDFQFQGSLRQDVIQLPVRLDDPVAAEGVFVGSWAGVNNVDASTEYKTILVQSANLGATGNTKLWISSSQQDMHEVYFSFSYPIITS